MTMMTQLTANKSGLFKSGENCRSLNLEALSIMEVEAFTAMRIRALPGLSQDTLIDLNLPPQTGMCSGENPVRLCLRPGEWLALGDASQELTDQFPGLHSVEGLCTWIETDGLAMLRIQGDAAPWLMRKNSGLDFSVNPDTRSHCAQCKFGRIRVLVYFRQIENRSGEFFLLVDRSLAAYLWTLLVSTASHAVELQKKYGRAKGRAQS